MGEQSKAEQRSDPQNRASRWRKTLSPTTSRPHHSKPCRHFLGRAGLLFVDTSFLPTATVARHRLAATTEPACLLVRTLYCTCDTQRQQVGQTYPAASRLVARLRLPDPRLCCNPIRPSQVCQPASPPASPTVFAGQSSPTTTSTTSKKLCLSGSVCDFKVHASSTSRDTSH